MEIFLLIIIILLLAGKSSNGSGHSGYGCRINPPPTTKKPSTPPKPWPPKGGTGDIKTDIESYTISKSGEVVDKY